MGRIKN